MENRFVYLETKVSYLERNLDDLNEVVIEQAKEIDQLRNQVHALIKHVQSSGPTLTDPKDEPPPPHY